MIFKQNCSPRPTFCQILGQYCTLKDTKMITITRSPFILFYLNESVMIAGTAAILLTLGWLCNHVAAKNPGKTRLEKGDIFVGSPPTGLTAKIVGGSNATTGQFPFFVSSKYCGASLIWHDIALAAAHCEGAYESQKVIVGGNVNFQSKVC